MACAALTRIVSVEATVGEPFQNTAMSSVSRPGVSRQMLAAISPSRVHLGDPGREQPALLGHGLAVVLIAADHPVLLAVGVQVVAAGVDAGLDHLGAVEGERADGVADHLGAREQLGEGIDGVLDLRTS